MRVLLVRHAHAGVRGTWPGDDLERPLSERGTAQAAAVAERWADAGVDALRSSRAVRCTATLAPLGELLGAPVTTDDELLEGADPGAALAWLTTLSGTPALCSHGDVIGGIVSLLELDGVALDRADGGPLDEPVWQKGSTWELEVEAGAVVRGTYHPPVGA